MPDPADGEPVEQDRPPGIPYQLGGGVHIIDRKRDLGSDDRLARDEFAAVLKSSADAGVAPSCMC